MCLWFRMQAAFRRTAIGCRFLQCGEQVKVVLLDKYEKEELT